MKKLMLMACALLLTGAFATGAMAADVSGLYLSGKFVYGYTQLDGFKATQYGSKTKLGDKDDNAWGGAFAVGYDFYSRYQVPLRAELEYSIFSGVEAKKRVADETASWDLKQKYNIQTLFLNGYWDIHNKTVCTPYITAGVGLAFINTKGTLDTEFEILGQTITGHTSTGSKLRTNFAWKVGLGAAFELTENISLDAGYTFAGLGKVKTKAARNMDDTHLKTDDIYMHQVAVGVRYTF